MNEILCGIVDDDRIKADRIAAVIASELGEGSVRIQILTSSHEAITAIRDTEFDLLVVDVNLPIRNGEMPSKDGGLKLLRQIGRGANGIRRPSFVIGMTGFGELVPSAVPEFAAFGWCLISYSPEARDWEEAVANQCKHVLEVKRSYSTSSSQDVDVVVMTALHQPELEMILHSWPCEFRTEAYSDELARYSAAKVEAKTKSLRVVACAAPEMGNAAAAALATKAIVKFRPKVVLMTGICAGIDAKVGDLVVAEFALHHESGKFTEGESGEAVFLPAPRYHSGGAKLIEALRRYQIDRADEILALPAGWREGTAPKMPEIKCGPVASGSAVVENNEIVKDLQFRDRKLVGLEMEGYGFYLACKQFSNPSVEYLMIKGVCDLAKPPKTNKYQKYAAYISALFCYKFLMYEADTEGGVFS